MRIAYVNYGNQSGVTPNVVRSLSALGHRMVPVDPTGILALRDPRTRLPRPTPRVLLSLAASALRHGPQLIHHRLNTGRAMTECWMEKSVSRPRLIRTAYSIGPVRGESMDLGTSRLPRNPAA